MILELAENANTYTPLGPGDERIVDDRFVLYLGRGDGPAWNVAQRFRLQWLILTVRTVLSMMGPRTLD